MSNSNMVTYKKLLNKHYNACSNKNNKKVTIHHMAGKLSLETCYNVFNGTRQASSNYGIDQSGKVGMYVEEKNRAWTSSSATNDYQAVTIECANDTLASNWTISKATFDTLIVLVADICKRNFITSLNYTGTSSGNLTTHDMFTNTNCPGPYLKKKMGYIADVVNLLLLKSIPTLKKGSKNVNVRRMQSFLHWIGMYNGNVNGEFGDITKSAVKAYQKKYGLYVDGEFGNKSLEKAKAIVLEKQKAIAKK